MCMKNSKKDIDFLVDEDLIEAEDDVPEEIERVNLAESAPKAMAKTPEEIMDKYNTGKEIAKKAEAIIRSVLNMDENKKLPNIIIRPEKIEDKNIEDIYLEAVKEYNRGMQMTLDAKEEMIIKLDMFIYYIIENRFSTFKKYTKDLYQEGILGILKGIDSYDAKKSKPTTYFYIYVLHEMTEYINSNINKTTSHYSANIVRVKKAVSELERNGRDWTVKDIAQETGISSETIIQSLKIMESSKEVHYDTVDYLDSKISRSFDSPEDEYIKNETQQILHKAVSDLGTDEASVVSLRHGLTGEEAMSFKKVAERLNLPIDKVRKYYNSGIRKLRRNKTIHGTFNLKKEARAINNNSLGVVPIEIGEKLMDQLLNADI